jgi:hypothetical protein
LRRKTGLADALILETMRSLTLVLGMINFLAMVFFLANIGHRPKIFICDLAFSKAVKISLKNLLYRFDLRCGSAYAEV